MSPQEFHRLLQEGGARNRQAHKVVCAEGGGRASSGRESVAATAGGVVDLSSLDAPTPADDRGGHLAEATPTQRSGHGTVVPRAMKERASTVLEGCAGAPALAAAPAIVGKGSQGGEGGKGDKDVPGCSDSAGANAEDATVAEEKEAVLLDVRNVYETSIGRFRCVQASWLLYCSSCLTCLMSVPATDGSTFEPLVEKLGSVYSNAWNTCSFSARNTRKIAILAVRTEPLLFQCKQKTERTQLSFVDNGFAPSSSSSKPPPGRSP